MQESDHHRFVVALAALAETFIVEATEALTQGYWLGLKDLPIEAVELACAAALRESQFFPRPVELRRLAGVIKTKDHALRAWEHVIEASKRSAAVDDPVARRAVTSLGGPKRMGQLTLGELRWARKDFLDCYEQYAEQAIWAERSDAVPKNSQIDGFFG